MAIPSKNGHAEQISSPHSKSENAQKKREFMQLAKMVLGPAGQKSAEAERLAVSPVVEKFKGLLAGMKKMLAPVAGEQKNALTVSGRVSLGPKKSLLLVEVRGQSFLVAMSGDSTPALMAVPENPAHEQGGTKKQAMVRKGRTSC
jgi:Flagellar biosynthesis protein, FliO